MTEGATFMTGEAAAELTGLSIAEIDQAAATGEIPAHYTGWQLLVDPHSLVPPEADTEAASVDDDGTWNDFTIPELKAALDAREIHYLSDARKADLVALLDEDDG